METEYFKQAPEADYGSSKKIKKKKPKSGITRKELWQALHDDGWDLDIKPDFEKIGTKFNMPAHDIELIFRYYWNTHTNLSQPVTAKEVKMRDSKRVHKIKDNKAPWED